MRKLLSFVSRDEQVRLRFAKLRALDSAFIVKRPMKRQ
jgi:hypothetical protein